MPFADEVIKRNHVTIEGSGDKTLLLAHGFGCDQNMWRLMLPALVPHYKVVLFDYVGSGNSDISHYDQTRYSSLEGYAQDVLDICQALDLQDVVFIGHSVSSMIGLIASIKQPELFSQLTMICPSPCFLNFEPDYIGGFEQADLEELIDLMDKNYIGWANYLAPLVMGANNSEELVAELSGSFCSTDPVVAKTFARATFFSDYRHLLKDAKHPVLIFQSSQDALASIAIGDFMVKQLPDAKLKLIEAKGHCLHMTHPDTVNQCLSEYLAQQTS
ncbi:alpha/beta fold hydrolase [Paraglaciecola arctica]|uniref:alpha/beta fold hydrolase n=1 Tax=Paraglaciecola arctica TaxID=1128911 RepID=UPI001C07E0BE|nr:alpha/beta hydrolase [Paraglaciecola arctica]MBU3004573.1 alpha/beta hydrolase [Paraglaciecola arctica]